MRKNDSLNAFISAEEILACIRKLNNGKACGLDKIINEHIKISSDTFLPIYVKLFNQINDTGIFPRQWSVGSIHPIYKNKGSRDDPANYRPITILSCLGKLFTAVLNTRLNDYLEESFLLNENQAGFRKHYSTLDHIFSLHTLIEILKANKQNLFCCFIDFSSAFDSIWRAGLWQKLLQHNVNEKIFNVITNMFKDIKSCVSSMGNDSAFFGSFSGVRQGENLSPILFALYLNDLERVLERNTECGILINYANDEMVVILKVFLLLYADDTVVLGNNEKDLQIALNEFYDYCQTWKLKINISKTKIVVFGSKQINDFQFKLGDENVEITDRYKYLGVYFSQSRSFLNARKHIAEQAKKAMFLLYFRINNLNLPIDLQLKLFDHTVLPILTYGCEIWSFENTEILERVHTEFLRRIIKSRKSTPLYSLYAELGRYPLDITMKTRTIGFWNKLILGKDIKISRMLYDSLRIINKSGFKWFEYVKTILRSVGRNDIWMYQDNINTFSLNSAIKPILIDQFLQIWRSEMGKSNKGTNYNIIKDNISLENYFTSLPTNLYLNLVRFRTGNHKLPVETGRWNDTDHQERKCLLCTKDTIGDEFHYTLECPFFKTTTGPYPIAILY